MNAHGRQNARWPAVWVALLATAMLVAVGQDSGLAAVDRKPVPFRLIFDGAYDGSLGQENPVRRGEFSAVAPLCPEGAAVDERYVYPSGLLREHTCADGSGAFTASVTPAVAEVGGAGTWQILGGTGRYSNLRGQGFFAGEFVSGSPSHEERVAFRTTWTGVVGFDAVAPTIRGIRMSVSRRRGHGSYVLRVSFRTRDDVPGNRVRYLVAPSSGGRALPFAEGRAGSATVSLTLEVGLVRPGHRVIVEIRATDPLGNEHRIVRSVAIEDR